MPTFDPRNLPPSSSGEGYQVTSTQTTMQRAFDRWLASPSPTSERLVDQALTSAGRPAMFGRVGASAQFARPFEMPWQVRSFRQREISDFSRQANERMLAEGRMRRTVQSRQPSFDIQAVLQRSYGGTPRSFGTNLADFAPTRTAGVSRLTGPAVFWPDDIKRLFKHMNTSLDQINKTDQRILYLSQGGGQGAASVGTPPRWRNMFAAGGAGLAASPAVGAALARHMNAALGGGGAGAGGGGGPGGAGGPAGGGNAFGGAFLGSLFGGRAGRFGTGVAASWEAAHWPSLVGHFARGEFDRAAPAASLRSRIADMTALPASLEGSGRVRRTTMEQNILPYAGQGAVPEWMTRLGLTQPGIVESLGRMGGGVQLGTNPLELARSVRSMRLGAGFRMAPEGSTENLAMMGQRFGITQAGEQAQFPGQFSQFMARGQLAGADSRDLLAAIKEATESLVKTGVKLDLTQTAGFAGFMQRMLSVGVPPAQAAAMAGQGITGMAGAGQRPFANSLSTSVFAQMISKTDFNDPSAVHRLLGKSPEDIMATGTPFEKQTLKLLQQDKTSPMAMRFGAQMIGASPKALGQVVGMLPGMTGMQGAQGEATSTMMLATLLGVDLPTAAAIIEGQNKRVRGKERHSRHVPHAGAPAPGTLPEDVFSADVETTTTALRGMRTQLEMIVPHLEKINRFFELGGSAGGSAYSHPGSSIGRTLWNMSPFGGSSPPGGGSGLGGAWDGIKNFFGFGGGTTAPSGGRLPDGTAPVPGTVVPRGGGRFGGLAPSGASLPGSTLAAISMAEGTFQGGRINYDDMLGHPGGKLGTPPKPISQMSLSELDKWQTQMLRNPNNKWNSSAAGAFQITRSNVRDLTNRWGLDPNTTLFDQPMQERMAGQIWRQQGSGAWEGFKAHPELRARAEALAGPRGSGVNVSYTASSGDSAGADYGGGGDASHAGLLDSFGTLGRIVRDTAEHLHDLGHGARNARSGIGGTSRGPNASTSPASAPAAAAYP